MARAELFTRVYYLQFEMDPARTNSLPKDIKPANMLIAIADTKEAVRDHLAKLEKSDTDGSHMNFLHSRPVECRSVSKSSNIDVKIIDFGVGTCIMPIKLLPPR